MPRNGAAPRLMGAPMLLQVALWVLEHRRNAYMPTQVASGTNRRN